MSRNATQLLEFLEAKFAACDGQMSFQEFMGLALYDPDFGYYTANIQTVGGRSADFSTWATLGNLGAAVAGWVTGELNHHQWQKQSWHLIEVGGGDGSLAKQVLTSLGWRTRRRLTYHLVDVSEPLQEQQKQALKKYRNVQWHANIDSALTASKHQALVFSNELVDAFPANWFRYDGQRWHEIMVRFDLNQGLSEHFEPVEESISTIQHTGQRIEKHWAYRDWLSAWSEKLSQGSILTIDYGHPETTKIYQNKLHGTMRGYFKQQQISGGDIYKRIGKQDLTCDVNFSEIKQWGEQQGWQTVSLVDQFTFIKNQHSTIDFTPQEQAAAAQFYVLNQRTLP